MSFATSGQNPVGDTFMPVVGQLADQLALLQGNVFVGFPLAGFRITVNLNLTALTVNGQNVNLTSNNPQGVYTALQNYSTGFSQITLIQVESLLASAGVRLKLEAAPTNNEAPASKNPPAFFYLYGYANGTFSIYRNNEPDMDKPQLVSALFTGLLPFEAAKKWIDTTTANFINTSIEAV